MFLSCCGDPDAASDSWLWCHRSKKKSKNKDGGRRQSKNADHNVDASQHTRPQHHDGKGRRRSSQANLADRPQGHDGKGRRTNSRDSLGNNKYVVSEAKTLKDLCHQTDEKNKGDEDATEQNGITSLMHGLQKDAEERKNIVGVTLGIIEQAEDEVADVNSPTNPPSREHRSRKSAPDINSPGTPPSSRSRKTAADVNSPSNPPTSREHRSRKSEAENVAVNAFLSRSTPNSQAPGRSRARAKSPNPAARNSKR